MASYAHFTDLPVYKKCREFRLFISLIVKKYFPERENFLLKSQVVRSSRSVTANIAEGFGRFHYQENIQFCRQGRGSLAESLEHMITANDEGYITAETLKEIEIKYKECLFELNKFIKYLKMAKDNVNNQ